MFPVNTFTLLICYPGHPSTLAQQDEVEHFMQAMMSNLPASESRLDTYCQGQAADATVSKVITYCQLRWTRHYIDHIGLYGEN